MRLTPAALLPFALLISCSDEGASTENTSDKPAIYGEVDEGDGADTNVAEQRHAYESAPAYLPPADHPNMTRDEQIQALEAEDPSSYGYTDDDREFLRSHGVSEAEARAMEDAMAAGGYRE